MYSLDLARTSLSYKMKLLRTVSILFVLFLSGSAHSQAMNTKSKDVKDLRGRTIIVSTKISIQQIYDNILFAFRKEWTLSDSVLQLQSGKAAQLLFSSEKQFARVQLKTYSLGSSNAIIDYEGDDSRVTSGVGRISKLLISTEDGEKYFISLPTDPDYTREMFVEAVRRGVFMLEEIEREGSWNKAYKSVKHKYAGELKSRTLLICDDYLEDSTQMAKIDSMIPFKKAFVDIKFIDSTLENKDNRFAYLVITGENVYANTKYICASENSKVLTRDHSASVVNTQVYQSDRDAKYYLRPQDIKAILRNLDE